MPDPAPKVDIKDWMRPESWLSVTGAGPLLASMAYALTVNLKVPSGYSMMFVALVFASCLPFVHGDEKRGRKVSMFLAGSLLLFVQAAGSSTLLAHSSADLDEHVMHLGESLCGLIIPEARAQDIRDEDAPAPLGWVCETIPEGYVLTSPTTGAPIVIPWLAANALLDHIAQRKAKEVDTKQSPWRIRFKN